MASTAPAVRAHVRLSDNLEHRLSAYALAAGAAGVGMLALAPSAAAKIVYTKAHVVIGRYTGDYGLDLNHDGIADMGLGVNLVRGVYYFAAFGAPGRGAIAHALEAGDRIGPKDHFYRVAYIARASGPSHYSYEFPSCCSTAWWKGAYAGVKFLIKGKVHYGWARLTIRTQISGMVGLLEGYAYETTPNKSIIAGQEETVRRAGANKRPGTLGTLALGAGNRKNATR